MISLFYQAWEKYRFTIAYERGERDRFSHHLLDLIGLGTPGLQERQSVPDDSLLFYSGLSRCTRVRLRRCSRCWRIILMFRSRSNSSSAHGIR